MTTPWSMDREAEREQIDLVVRRLSLRFHHLPEDVVLQAVDQAAAGLEGARIREFVPLLVEREARDWLAREDGGRTRGHDERLRRDRARRGVAG